MIGGFNLPLLLRPVQMGYVLLGPVFVTGVMHGEICAEENMVWEELVIV
jgi:hypothetical protein